MKQNLKRMPTRAKGRLLLAAVVAAAAMVQPGGRGGATAQGTVRVLGWVDATVQSYMTEAQWDYVKSTTSAPFGRVQQADLGPIDELVSPPTTVITLAQVLANTPLQGQGTAQSPWHVTRGVEWDGYGDADAVPLEKYIDGTRYRYADHIHMGPIAAAMAELEGSGPVCLRVPAGYYEEWEVAIPANIWVQGEGQVVFVPRTPYPYPPTSAAAMAAGKGRKRLIRFAGNNGGLSDVTIDGAGRPEVTGLWVSSGCTGIVIANNTLQDLRGADLGTAVTGWAPGKNDPPATKTSEPVVKVVANTITRVGRSGVRPGPNWLVRSNVVTYAGVDRQPNEDLSDGDCGIIADAFTVGVRIENNLVITKEEPAARHAIAAQAASGPAIRGNICILEGPVRGGIVLADHTNDARVQGNAIVCVVDPATCPGPAACEDADCLTGSSTHRTHEAIIAFGDRNDIRGNAVVGTIFGVKITSTASAVSDGNRVRYNYLEVAQPWKDKAKTEFTAVRADRSATNTTISSNWPVEFPASFVMGKEGRPDIVVSDPSGWIGYDTHDPTGIDQKTAHNVIAGKQTVYKIRAYNNSATQQAMRIVGPGGEGKWRLSYVRKNGEDVTARVTGDGWEPKLPAGGYTQLHVHVRTQVGQAEGTTHRMLVRAGFARWSDSEFDAEADAGKLTTRIVVPPQQERPDVWVADRAAWIGDNIYNGRGTGQRTTNTVNVGYSTTYKFRVYNDSATTETMRIMGQSGTDDWRISYKTADGVDVTQEMMTTGWRPDLEADGRVELRLRADAKRSAAPGSRLPILVHAGFDKWDASTYSAQADVGKFTTRVASDSSGTVLATGLAAVPTSAGAQVSFSLSSAASVSARILNIAGRPVKTLCTARACEAGMNTLLWNATSDRGTRVPNGTYLVEVTANGVDGSVARGVTQATIRR